MKKHKLSIFIFRRDLRLEDNTSLIKSLIESEKIIPIFIFNKKQISSENEYRSLNAMQFLKEALEDLNEKLILKKSKLYLFYDKIDNIIEKLNEEFIIDAIYFNKEYTPFGRLRDKQIKDFCIKKNIECITEDDLVLNKPQNCLNLSGKAYTIFTPFFKKNSLLEIKYPLKNNYENYFNENIDFSLKEFPKEFFEIKNKNLILKAKREFALNCINENLKNYSETRDIPILNSTSHLSAYLKFGLVSVREIYYQIKEKLGEEHPLIRQLYWRDFFYNIAYFYPKVFGISFYEKYEKIIWEKNNEKFEAWKNGKTGFPIVDAGMRELNETGFMHNRLRMITASFLVKDLHIDWREGEKYFATKLIDYDPSLNNGNWQWAASTGCDAQPYFRIFNPWRQQERFDPKCEYILKWVPELKNLNPKQIHNLYKLIPPKYQYIKPIIEHDIESKLSKEIYQKC